MKDKPKKATYAFHIYDSQIGKTIAFRPLSMEEDVHRLHKWMNMDHVIPFWQLDGPLLPFQKHLQSAMADQHQTLYIGYLDGVPMSYWETYWVKDDVIGEFYSCKPSDQGVHLLIGPKEYVGKGYAFPLLRAMIAFQFQKEETEKIVAEPDIRNKKMIHVFKQCNFRAEKPVDLPDKRAMLMCCHRKAFEKGARRC